VEETKLGEGEGVAMLLQELEGLQLGNAVRCLSLFDGMFSKLATWEAFADFAFPSAYGFSHDANG
jgi:hypothetical protein